ncbi:aminoglycoside phosphotransferase family protein [Actinopolymorpha pittospori]|uniref:Aminoglycoside phosphotransferase (APT) family kinase protein n=1 Tax=Actinopolymorpha pittospori TaxID=648752 RepID=A0A927MRG1_9ACTN|nr:aminoglycoside phosphotransferase family protein [Actinopolymorpha pittospori]MBE1605525.1 aminoglycoside phosphotransferase (APT) family kinase protein [Actinopolymorpha pittospori]
MPDEQTPVSARRSAAEGFVSEVNAQTGSDLRLVGLPDLGTPSGAAYVRWPDGRPGVLTRSILSPDTLHVFADILAMASARGVPVPRYELITALSQGSAVVQQRLPGSPPRHIDPSMVDAMVAVNESFAGLLADWPQVEVPQLHLRQSGEGTCLHETLQRYDDRSRRLLGWIRDVATTGPDQLTGDDLVHWDFVPGNLLFDPMGAVTGVVDWFTIARGDRHFGLMKVRFNLGHFAADGTGGYPTVTAAAISRLDDLLDQLLEPATYDLYWAHWSLALVDWTIRQGQQSKIDAYLDLANTRIR